MPKENFTFQSCQHCHDNSTYNDNVTTNCVNAIFCKYGVGVLVVIFLISLLGLHDNNPSVKARPIKALPNLSPVNVPEFPWWALPIPSKTMPWMNNTGMPHFPILDNLFLLLKASDLCFNCTIFVSLDTTLDVGNNTEDSHFPTTTMSFHLLQYQVVPFHLRFDSIALMPMAFRIPSFVNGSYLLITDSASTAMSSNSSTTSPQHMQVSINYQGILAPDFLVSDTLVVHGITGFLSPFILDIPFPT